MDHNLYITLLRFALNPQADIPACVKDTNWHELREFAKKQAIAGVYWQGIERLKDIPENKPTDDDVMEWMMTCTNIIRRNKTVDEKAAWVSGNFKKEGFSSCLLKGQGNALMYPNPSLRTSGDIDIWIRPEKRSGNLETDIDGIISYCRKIVPKTKACYHHIDFKDAGDVPVEVHYRPSWLNNPFNNARLQKYFDQYDFESLLDTEKGFKMPSWEFNVVFQLCHIYNHITHEGIGLRQLIDYFYLLLSNPSPRSSLLEKEIRHLGLQPIASAVMWILSEVLGLEKRYLICAADKKRGRFLMKEILAGGNFGKYDERTLSGVYKSPLKANIQRLIRDCRLVCYFPSECLWEPYFRFFHFFWRLRKKRKSC